MEKTALPLFVSLAFTCDPKVSSSCHELMCLMHELTQQPKISSFRAEYILHEIKLLQDVVRQILTN